VNAYDAVIRSMSREGYTVEQISANLSVSTEEVAAIIAADVETMPEVADLLAWAAAHDDTKVRTDGEQAAAALAALRERRAVDAELETITSEEQQLEKRLTELRDRKSALQPQPAGAKRRRAQRDYEPSTVRAWARANGHAVPDRGQIPKKVLNAWRQNRTPRLTSVS
jgi:chromosome segregation ATPase